MDTQIHVKKRKSTPTWVVLAYIYTLNQLSKAQFIGHEKTTRLTRQYTSNKQSYNRIYTEVHKLGLLGHKAIPF
jgi:hypothetical protein